MYHHITLQKHFIAEIRQINWGKEAIRMGIRDVGYQLYRTAPLHIYELQKQ